MKLYQKIGIFSFLYYLFNLIIYFAYERSKSLETIENLKHNSETIAKLKRIDLSIEFIQNSMLPDYQLFNPAANLGYSFSSWHYWLVSSIFSFGTMLFIIKSNKNQPN